MPTLNELKPTDFVAYMQQAHREGKMRRGESIEVKQAIPFAADTLYGQVTQTIQTSVNGKNWDMFYAADDRRVYLAPPEGTEATPKMTCKTQVRTKIQIGINSSRFAQKTVTANPFARVDRVDTGGAAVAPPQSVKEQYMQKADDNFFAMQQGTLNHLEKIFKEPQPNGPGKAHSFFGMCDNVLGDNTRDAREISADKKLTKEWERHNYVAGAGTKWVITKRTDSYLIAETEHPSVLTDAVEVLDEKARSASEVQGLLAAQDDSALTTVAKQMKTELNTWAPQAQPLGSWEHLLQLSTYAAVPGLSDVQSTDPNQAIAGLERLSGTPPKFIAPPKVTQAAWEDEDDDDDELSYYFRRRVTRGGGGGGLVDPNARSRVTRGVSSASSRQSEPEDKLLFKGKALETTGFRQPSDATLLTAEPMQKLYFLFTVLNSDITKAVHSGEVGIPSTGPVMLSENGLFAHTPENPAAEAAPSAAAALR